MVSSVYWEWELFLTAVKLGVKLALFYDVIRIFRFLIVHKNGIVSLEDFFFWMYATLMIFRLQLAQSNGILRGFCILGMILGMMLYESILGERLVKTLQKGIGFTKRRLTESVKMLKMKIYHEGDTLKNSGSKHGRKKNSGKEKEAKQLGNAFGNDGGFGNDGSSSC